MPLTKQLAQQLKEVYFGKNWTNSDIEHNLKNISWQTATTQVFGLNSIATLMVHMHYYVATLRKVLEGKPLDAKDEYSFILPTITAEEDWAALLRKMYQDAKITIALIEKMSDEKLKENFTDKKYGSYYRNITGTIEHLYYHLGQIALLKKILIQKSS